MTSLLGLLVRQVLFLGDGEDPGNLSPTEVAAMMHRLEHGVSMSAPPDQLFKFLFPHADSEVSTVGTSPSRRDSHRGKSTWSRYLFRQRPFIRFLAGQTYLSLPMPFWTCSM